MSDIFLPLDYYTYPCDAGLKRWSHIYLQDRIPTYPPVHCPQIFPRRLPRKGPLENSWKIHINCALLLLPNFHECMYPVEFFHIQNHPVGTPENPEPWTTRWEGFPFPAPGLGHHSSFGSCSPWRAWASWWKIRWKCIFDENGWIKFNSLVCVYIYRKINILYSINGIFIWFNLIYIHYMICWLKIWRFPAYIHVSFLGKEQGGGVNEKANKRLVDIARLMQLEEQAPTAKTTTGNYWQILTQ